MLRFQKEVSSGGSRSNLSKTHRALATARKKRTLTQRFKCIYSVLCIVCVYSWEVVCTYHCMRGGQRPPAATAFSSHHLVPWDQTQVPARQPGPWLTSHLCSPTRLVLKTMWSRRRRKLECGSKMFVVTNRKAHHHTFRVAICKNSHLP